MIQSKIVEIGEQALNPEDGMLILFDEQATEELKKFSVIQQFESQQPEFDLKKASTIFFDNQEYTIQHVGEMANEHLKVMGHVSVVFKDVSEMDELANAIFVSPYKMPILNIGTTISYKA